MTHPFTLTNDSATDQSVDRMPGRIGIVVPGKLAKLVAKPLAGSTFVLPDAGSDPTLNGGSLAVFDTAGPESDVYALPTSGWKGLGNPAGTAGYKYKGAGSMSDPCRVVCRGAGITHRAGHAPLLRAIRRHHVEERHGAPAPKQCSASARVPPRCALNGLYGRTMTPVPPTRR